MCLAVPMKLVEVHEFDQGVAELDGVSCPVNLSLVQKAAVGDYVVIHAGFAIEKLDEEEAHKQIRFFKELE